MKRQIKKTIAILLAVCFVLSITAASVSADQTQKNADKKPVMRFLNANFMASPTIGKAPLVVKFFDRSRSSSPIISWRWSFGDGHFSNLRNPVHKYSKAGIYTVSLTVKNRTRLMDTETKRKYIIVKRK
jgi:PKD repeat protein